MICAARFDKSSAHASTTATDMLGNVLPRAAQADIALLLEGTFPYRSGGVSNWVERIICAFPEYTFALCFLGGKEEDYGVMPYALPENVVHLENHFLFPPSLAPSVKKTRGDRKSFDRMEKLHEEFRSVPEKGLTNELLKNVLGDLMPHGCMGESQFLYSLESWQFILEQYRTHCIDPSFTDYFWSVRTMHRPLWRLAQISEGMIPVKAYHTISTGYAGLLGALLHYRHGRPLLISEHGIYTKERKIELFQNQWIRDNRNLLDRDAAHIGYFHQLWTRFFETLARIGYAAADDIVALYEGNRLRQISDGAPVSKTRTVPNGIDLQRFVPLRAKRPTVIPKVACLVGRVVPIKDVKTFIRSMLTISRQMPEAQGWIAGPDAEDESYAAECRGLIENLGLMGRVKLIGMQRMEDLLPQIGVLVLSSISEALPLALLEGFAAGVPAVATDVGACRELIYGLGDDDAKLGPAGRIVPIANSAALAQEIVGLLGDETTWRAAQQAGIARVERYYTQQRMVDSYRELYIKLCALPTLRNVNTMCAHVAQ